MLRLLHQHTGFWGRCSFAAVWMKVLLDYTLHVPKSSSLFWKAGCSLMLYNRALIPAVESILMTIWRCYCSDSTFIWISQILPELNGPAHQKRSLRVHRCLWASAGWSFWSGSGSGCFSPPWGGRQLQPQLEEVPGESGLQQGRGVSWFLCPGPFLRKKIRLFCCLFLRIWLIVCTSSTIIWPVEGFGHADGRLDCKRFGVASAFILLCWRILLFQLLLLCLRATVLVLMHLLLPDLPVHAAH